MKFLSLFVLKLLDVFGHKSNVSLVFDFMETDLEVLETSVCTFLLMIFMLAYQEAGHSLLLILSNTRV